MKKGFISTTFLIAMCSILMVIAAKSDYSYKCNMALANLNEMKEDFKIEANIINYCKCTLIRKEDLDSFDIDGVEVNVFQNDDGYDLYYKDHCITIDVYDNLIVDYRFN